MLLGLREARIKRLENEEKQRQDLEKKMSSQKIQNNILTMT